MNPDGLLVEGLCVSYRRFGRRLPVLFDVDVAVAPGEALGVVGESGCGKSTLALAIVRFLPNNGSVESGRVCIGGRDVLNLDRQQLRELRGRRVGMVYQDPGAALNPALRVGEQVAEVFQTHEKCSKKEATERAVDMLERVHLLPGVRMLRRYPHQLSGGQQQRVVIAMALAGNPEVLILDEPTTGLDATVEAEVLDLVSELRRQYHTALLFISHNLAVVGQVCERVAVLYAGRVVETGAAFDLFRRPRHPYTHGLLACVPKVGADKRANRLESIPGSLPILGSLVHGCQFSPRCVLADDACRQEEPELEAVGATQLSRCLRAAEVPEPDRSLVAAGGPATPVRLRVSGAAAEPLPAGGLLPPDGSEPSPTAPAVKVEALTKVFPGGVVACDAVSLEIARGETVGLVGESGSGKSTLARCIAGLTVADEGEIWLDGSAVPMRLAQRTEPERRSVQMVFQNPDTTLNPRHSVSYVLRRAVRKLGGRTDAESLAAQTGIGPTQLAVRAGQLSGGQRQRVAIARAFAGSPLLVLCDEPVSSLDVSVQATILNLFADFQRSTHVSYLFVSHDLGVVRYLADRIIVMYRGRVLEEGRAADVFNPPHHPYTEALFSALPVLGEAAGRHRIRLTSELPAVGGPPEGCCFQTRCPRKLGAICEEERPPERLLGDGHVVRCHLTREQLMEVQQRRPAART